MKGFYKDKILQLLVHPAILAIPPFLICLLWIFPVKRYKLEYEVVRVNSKPNSLVKYYNIDSDPGMEKIFVTNHSTKATIIVYDDGGNIYEAYSLEGQWDISPNFTVMNRNNDSTVEFYGLTINSGDSLMLNWFEMGKRNDQKKSVFLSQLLRYDNELDVVIYLLGFCDITGDGKTEIIINQTAGFALQPRNIIAYDFENKKLITSPFAGISYRLNSQLISADIDQHPGEEIFCIVNSPDNYRESIPYPDSVSYAVVLTSNLEYLFPPLPVGGPQTQTCTFPFVEGDSTRILVVSDNQRLSDNKITFTLLNLEGKILHQRKNPEITHPVEAIYLNDQVVLIEYSPFNTTFYTIDSRLNLRKLSVIEEQGIHSYNINPDLDNESELIMHNPINGHISCIDDNLRDHVGKNIVRPGEYIRSVSIAGNKKGHSKISLFTTGGEYMIHYLENNLYPFIPLLVIFIYLGSFSILLLLQKAFTFQARQKQEIESKMMNFQLQSVMNQLNPHFTFNAINSIGDAVLDGRNQEAYEYFTKLADLIRKSMKNALIPWKSLGEEIEFVREYLEIEKYRFENRLEWDLRVNPDVNKEIQIPKMLIHIFVENAIKHGIFQKGDQGKVDIEIKKLNQKILIVVEDNGTGINQKQKNEAEKGRGLKILNNYLEIFSQMENKKIEYQIEDLSETGNGRSGTRVEIIISL